MLQNTSGIWLKPRAWALCKVWPTCDAADRGLCEDKQEKFADVGRNEQILGDSPLRVLVKLVVVSILVGFVMTVFGWYPTDIYFAVRNFLLDLWYTGFAALGRVGDYLLLGAAIVVPAFVILRVLSYRR